MNTTDNTILPVTETVVIVKISSQTILEIWGVAKLIWLVNDLLSAFLADECIMF